MEEHLQYNRTSRLLKDALSSQVLLYLYSKKPTQL